jgi:hypothetical protein
MDLRKLDETQLQTILRFTEALVNRQTASGEINFDVPDVEQAEIQAKHFVERRKRGYRSAEIEGDAEIRTGIREWVKRTNRYTKL